MRAQSTERHGMLTYAFAGEILHTLDNEVVGVQGPSLILYASSLPASDRLFSA